MYNEFEKWWISLIILPHCRLIGAAEPGRSSLRIRGLRPAGGWVWRGRLLWTQRLAHSRGQKCPYEPAPHPSPGGGPAAGSCHGPEHKSHSEGDSRARNQAPSIVNNGKCVFVSSVLLGRSFTIIYLYVWISFSFVFGCFDYLNCKFGYENGCLLLFVNISL
jgi:hypothetical protein